MGEFTERYLRHYEPLIRSGGKLRVPEEEALVSLLRDLELGAQRPDLDDVNTFAELSSLYILRGVYTHVHPLLYRILERIAEKRESVEPTEPNLYASVPHSVPLQDLFYYLRNIGKEDRELEPMLNELRDSVKSLGKYLMAFPSDWKVEGAKYIYRFGRILAGEGSAETPEEKLLEAFVKRLHGEGVGVPWEILEEIAERYLENPEEGIPAVRYLRALLNMFASFDPLAEDVAESLRELEDALLSHGGQPGEE